MKQNRKYHNTFYPHCTREIIFVIRKRLSAYVARALKINPNQKESHLKKTFKLELHILNTLRIFKYKSGW